MPTTAQPGTRTATLIACGLFAAKIAVFVLLAVNTRFVMDEFWQFGQARDLSKFFDTIWPVKAPGYALVFRPAFVLGDNSAQMLMLGRLTSVLLSLLTCLALWRIARLAGETRLRALVLLILLFSVSTWIERAFRLRAEVPALLFATLALWVLVRHATRPASVATVAAGVLAGLAFLSTQKAIYFDLALGLALCGNAFLLAGTWVAIRAGLLLILGWLLAVSVFCFAFGGVEALAVARHLIVGPADLAAVGGQLYDDLGAFIIQTLSRNAVIYSVCVAGLLATLVAFPRLSPERRVAALFSATIVPLVFLHNQPWPYLFIWALPFLVLWSPAAWDILGKRRPVQVAGAAIVAIAVAAGFLRNIAYLDQDNTAQLDLIARAEALLAPDESYFDGIGMIAARDDRPRRWLDARGVRRVVQGGDDLMAELTADPPTLVIETYRTHALPPEFAAWLTENYGRVSPGIWRHGALPTADVPPRTPLFEGVYTR